ncbi:hypothetical protein AVEN_158346-1 [Araneus ventricosus]|uniref:Uncharacterized protein n=1 Tax=Araneus ventricosus TaxID=182803 RepID=A0A4Y2FBF0_ARAVE|nr:hypothetical protein AVEN_158346-1 [Araneus ventricosus]
MYNRLMESKVRSKRQSGRNCGMLNGVSLPEYQEHCAEFRLSDVAMLAFNGRYCPSGNLSPANDEAMLLETDG